MEELQKMLAPSGSLLRAGIGLKLNQIKLATRSYLRDRTQQATGTMASYAIAAALFAVAGLFVVAACLVGGISLYRWVAIHYGQFWGFGAVGALFAALAAICAGIGTAKLSPATADFPSLTSRLRVAIKSAPLSPQRIETATDTAAAVLKAPSTPPSGERQRARSHRNLQIGLFLTATLLGLAAARHRNQTRQLHAGQTDR